MFIYYETMVHIKFLSKSEMASAKTKKKPIAQRRRREKQQNRTIKSGISLRNLFDIAYVKRLLNLLLLRSTEISISSCKTSTMCHKIMYRRATENQFQTKKSV